MTEVCVEFVEPVMALNGVNKGGCGGIANILVSGARR